MTARVSMLMKSRASLTCFRARFLPGRAKDLTAPRDIYIYIYIYIHTHTHTQTAGRQRSNFQLLRHSDLYGWLI